MKKIRLSAILCFAILFSSSAFAQQKSLHLGEVFKTSKNLHKTTSQVKSKKSHPNPEAIIEMLWNGSDYDTTGKTEYLYNASGDVTLSLSYRYSNGNYTNFFHDSVVYNSNGQVLERTTKHHDGTQWQNQFREVYTYNSNGDIEEELWQNWSPVGLMWTTVWGSKYTYTYNSSNQPTQIVVENKSQSQPTYSLGEKQEIFYDANNLPEEVLFSTYDAMTTNWDLEMRAVNISWHKWTGSLYDPMITSADLEFWDGTQWEKELRISAAYNNDDNLLHETYEYWDGSAYVYEWRETYTYDSYGNVLTYFDEEYDEMASAWDTADGENHIYDYNANNSIATDVMQDYRSGDWENISKMIYIYSPASGIAKKTSQAALEVYPNPAADVLNLKLDEQRFTVRVIDLGGRMVLTAQNDKTLDVSSLSRGIYMVNVTSDKGTSTIKFVKN